MSWSTDALPEDAAQTLVKLYWAEDRIQVVFALLWEMTLKQSKGNLSVLLNLGACCKNHAWFGACCRNHAWFGACCRNYAWFGTCCRNQAWTGARIAVVSASDCGSEGLGFESHQSYVGFFSPGRLLPRVGSAMGPVGRLEPHSRASSTSRMHLWGCCSNYLTNTAGAAVSGPG